MDGAPLISAHAATTDPLHSPRQGDPFSPVFPLTERRGAGELHGTRPLGSKMASLEGTGWGETEVLYRYVGGHELGQR